ncbi:MAG: hypothetical protein US93_C0002G0034 [Candidatus Falkowbacteria bacterium GW2011_GWD2_38_42]|uniref:Uncharacterized protein n=1 Tax=Candidatus Falkowbacteria bacterium GW2011_GWE1_38_31 TaxID=1618638 RepID=A0A0G0JX29_9BACT|nr:MAG: hypothetical protein US73_C0001G0034 [Candidatus Falkowbacteria bacterium GW2011_GWF2_38_1205]KKQ64002.1 MAG: hypothetical protein US84_C0002G0034 [Candidatus Falkowbacteria bacterium GW2011_GWF1_38_22]KKQ66650.1 MAG: hypothetical protein US87_C0001G0171 [Candidatus Falkowbacteria bacterium GW2011_GWE2_38_254]KKQ71107.1 MAG: hypothetical protein US91_C0001G0034 [Candidatus Falkowbacteria bacterium GW2011_GWE1_38_31]KKQ73233.1 MAG: hypothetical protein US93_C0002G0034 [Candidatus Falkowb
MATPRSSQSVQQIPVPAPAQKESNASELESMKKLKLN